MMAHKSLSFQIVGVEDFLTRLPEDWGNYWRGGGEQGDEVFLRISKDEALDNLKCPDGWSLDMKGKRKRAVFAEKGKPIFSLDYSIAADEVSVSVRRDIGGYVRTGILYGLLTAFYKTCVGIHGVTLQCEGQTVILSAPSGTGKTTLCQLLVKHAGARVINGDFALLTVSNDGVMFEPTPFCGSSGICENERLRVERIVFLSQSKENTWQELDGRQSIRQFANNSFQAAFDSELQQCILSNVIKMIASVKIHAYAFAPTEEAALLFRDRITHE